MSSGRSDAANLSLTQRTYNIFSLPVEVLQMIFSVILTDTFWASCQLGPSSEINVPKIRTELQLVCKLWRSSILSCPRLWTNLDLQFSSRAAVWRSVDLSGTAPLLFSSYRPYSGGFNQLSEDLETIRVVAKLFSTEAHRIAALLLHGSHNRHIVADWSKEYPILPSHKATALQHFELIFHFWEFSAENLAPDPLWLSILARAPNLTSFKLSGMFHRQFWTTLATSTPLTQLRSLELGMGASFSILDFTALIGRLPELESLILRDIVFDEFTVRTAAAALENVHEIELRQLRYVHFKRCQSVIFSLIQKLVLPPRVNIVLDIILMDPHCGDEDTILRCIPRIVASVLPESMDALSLSLGKEDIIVSGRRELGAKSGGLLHLIGDRKSRPFDPQPTAVHFLRDILACLPLERTRVLWLDLPSEPCAVYEHIAALRPVLARLTRVETAVIRNTTHVLAMSALVQLLRVEDEESVPLPHLDTLVFTRKLSWCPKCVVDVLGPLCDVLGVRVAGGRPITRVTTLESPDGSNVPEDLEAAVRVQLEVWEDVFGPPEAMRTGDHECTCKKDGGVRTIQAAGETDN